MRNLRHDRVSELIKRHLGELIRREFSVEECGVISVNDVVMSNDLHSATVFVGVVGSEDQRRTAFSRLRKHRARLQSLVAGAVVLKYTPHLRFARDTAVERGNRVLAILDELEQSEPPE